MACFVPCVLIKRNIPVCEVVVMVFSMYCHWPVPVNVFIFSLDTASLSLNSKVAPNGAYIHAPPV